MSVDVVIVSYASRATLRASVSPLCRQDGVKVIVVDNASPDDALATIDDLPVQVIRAGRNGGFSFGCNRGSVVGDGDYVLFLNPDAVLPADQLETLVAALEREPGTGVVGPRILDAEGRLLWTQRRAPSLIRTLAQALFLHRVFPRAAWADEMICDSAQYERSATPDWLSGACLLVRRPAFEAIGGFDEGFFLYCEDTDLCARLREAGHETRFVPDATAWHQEGSSAPRSHLAAIHARSRIRYAELHSGRVSAWLQRAAIGLWALSHAAAAAPREREAARGHVAALRAVFARSGS